MSPIFVRPVREQLEHDRLIRFLQTKYERKFDAATNVGDERLVPVKIGPSTFFPDLVLMSGKKLDGVVEVETGESVNNLEAMAEWVPFSRRSVAFHLYVPVAGYDAARRFCDAHHVRVAEIWTYRAVVDGFDLVRVFQDTAAPRARPKPAPRVVEKPVEKAATRPKTAPAKPKAKPKAKAKPPARKPVPAKRAAPKTPSRKPAGKKSGRARAR